METLERLGTDGDDRYRVLDEARVVRVLGFTSWPEEARDDPDRAARRGAETVSRLVANGLPFRRVGPDRHFDFCEVINFLKTEGLAGREPTYTAWAVPAHRRLTHGSMRVDRPATAGSGEHDPRRFVVTLRREFNLEGKAPGTPSRLRLPVPYEDETQRDLLVEVLGPTSPEVRVVRGPGRLEFRLPLPADPSRVSVGARFEITAYQQSFAPGRGGGRPAALGDDEVELYTRPNEGLIQVTPAVRDLARSLAGPGDDPWTALGAFWAFFFDRMKAGFIHHDELDRSDLLGSLVRRGWFDCYSGSALLAGLCRSRGIPARIVHGAILHEAAPCFHYWTEVFLPTDGWVPVDLISWELSAGKPDEDPWGRLFLGRMEYRLKCQRFPHLFLGHAGVRFPSRWQMDQVVEGEGTEIAYYGLEPHRVLFRDFLRVSRSGGPDP